MNIKQVAEQLQVPESWVIVQLNLQNMAKWLRDQKQLTAVAIDYLEYKRRNKPGEERRSCPPREVIFRNIPVYGDPEPPEKSNVVTSKTMLEISNLQIEIVTIIKKKVFKVKQNQEIFLCNKLSIIGGQVVLEEILTI